MEIPKQTRLVIGENTAEEFIHYGERLSSGEVQVDMRRPL